MEHGQGNFASEVLDFSSSAESVRRALEGTTCAIHCAGHYEAGREELDEYVGSVEKLADAADQCGLERLVLLSSVAVYGSDLQGWVGIDTTPTPDTPYAQSRKRAEDVAKQRLSASRTRLVIVRVPAVVGAEMRSRVLRRFFGSLRAGVFLHPGRKEALFACVGIHRLAECVARLADPEGGKAPAVVQAVDCYRWVDLADRFGSATGHVRPRIALPGPAVRFICRAVGYDIDRALKALDSTACYEDNSPQLAASGVLPDSMDDIDALIAEVR